MSCPSDVWRHQVCFQIVPVISTFVWAVGPAAPQIEHTAPANSAPHVPQRPADDTQNSCTIRNTITTPPPILNTEVPQRNWQPNMGTGPRNVAFPPAQTPERNQGQPGGQVTCPGCAWGREPCKAWTWKAFPGIPIPPLSTSLNRTVSCCFRELFPMVRREKIN